MFRWIPEATREQKEQVKEELGRLPGLVPEVRAYHLGEDLGLVGDLNFDFALDGTDHATHQQQASMIRRYIIWRNNHAYDQRLRRITDRANIA